MNYLVHLVIMIGIYLLLAYSLNLVVGFCGLFTLCHAAFYGIGAYIYALGMMKFNFPFLLSLCFCFLMTGLAAFVLSFPALKFRGDSFVLVTLGFQVIIFSLLYNWVGLTRGPYGICGIPEPEIAGWKIDSPPEYLLLISILDLAIFSLLFILYRSPFGLTLKALRDDERAGEALGKSVFTNFMWAFTLGGAFAAIPGAFYASYVTYIDPTSFDLNESIFQLAILLLGGSGNIIGPLAGVVVMVLLPEALRFLGLPDTVAPNVRQIIYAILLVIIMYARPSGIAGEFEVR